ncbi:transketolase C-terminal domain-containing protein [Ramlibacter tataouinensis]|uniref:transketolase C-terminal domain-containing protein n=1 Tax=Ramlibacter tataouinensis TaxID=94132 RepID=UPI0022F3B1C9|nr:transketolase C-terminal domain-containing protein [Ramlibacter tataouinensis]WBY03208.1 transketolase C-terminal domain-containing protein [Ramlibacter tataouinensis]
MNQSQTLLLDGNHAVSWAARLARPQVVPVYPITPQTPILELITEFHANGEMDAEILTPESEHSVLAACVPASLAGARVFTATASQGLLLMHEVLHYAAGARAPIVMANVNRTVASPWAFWPDQTDSLAQRDTGWLQYYSESPQESLDSVLQAFRVAEQVGLPAMVNHDAFYVSHSLEPVQVPAQATVDGFLPPYAPAQRLSPELGSSWGNVVSQDMYYRHRQAMDEAMARALAAAQEADLEWARLTGRAWGILERYRCEGARVVLVALGSLCGTTREAIDALRAEGIAAGLLKLRLLRPLPQAALRAALAGVPDVLVLDRDHSPGLGGILHQEIRGALYGLERAPRVHGLLAGVGGVNVPPQRICELVRAAIGRAPAFESTWG